MHPVAFRGRVDEGEPFHGQAALHFLQLLRHKTDPCTAEGGDVVLGVEGTVRDEQASRGTRLLRFQHPGEEPVLPELGDGIECLTHRILVELFRPGTWAEDHLDVQVGKQVRIPVEGSACSEAVTHEQQDALGMGDLMVALLGK